MDPNLVAAVAIAVLGTAWVALRSARCCGQPEACPHLQKNSPFLARCLDADGLPRCPHALPALALHLLRAGATGHALAAAARAASAGQPGALLVLARIHSDLRNSRFALELWRRAIARDDHPLAAWLALGAHFAAAGDYPNALRHFRRAAEVDPACADAWCSLGRCYAALDVWSDARVCYEVALRRTPGHLPTMHALGLVQVGAGDLRSAIRTFEEILDVAGASGPLLARLGRLARESGDMRRAVVYLRDAMKLSGLPEVKRDLAEIYEAMGQTELAEFYRQEFEAEFAA